MLDERRTLAQDGEELGLTFGSNDPVAQEIEVTGIVTKRGWEVKLAPCPLRLLPPTLGRVRVGGGTGWWEGARLASGPRKAALYHTVPLICVAALRGGVRWQHGGGGKSSSNIGGKA